MTSTPPPTSGASSAPLPAWIAEAAVLLGLSPDDVPVQLLLNLARDAAHGVARPAAPLTTFLAGLAAGRAGGSRTDVERAVSTLVAALAARPGDGDAQSTRSAPA